MRKTVKYVEISEKERVLREILESSRLTVGKREYLGESLSREWCERED